MTISLSNTRHRSCAGPKAAQATPLSTYFTVWKQRRELSRMGANRLKDLGISPDQAAAEANRRFWDVS